MATPFSPFVRRPKPAAKRRQSDRSDLIDWDAPEIPEAEKHRIIYEEHINDLKEDFEIKRILNEQIHEAVVEELKTKLKSNEAQNSLLLNQLKMFEESAMESATRIDQLEAQLKSESDFIATLEQEREDWLEERNNLQAEIENLNFKINETTCELNHNLEIYVQKRNEAEDMKKKFEAVKNQLSYYKKLAKNRDQDDYD